MSNKKQLNVEQLEKVTGGDRVESDAFACPL